jgi:hypothetical protein
MKRVISGAIVCVTVCASISGCKTPTASAVTVAQALKQCAVSDVLPADLIVYTGPTGAGPGSYWVSLNGTNTQLTIGAEPTDIFGPNVPANIFGSKGQASSCDFSSSSTTEVKLNVGADLTTLPLSASAEADLKDATVLSVTADGFQWEPIKYLVFNQEIAKSPYVKALLRKDLWVSIGMLKIRNYVANLDVSKVRNVDLSAKYNGKLSGSVAGNLSAGVTGSYDGKATLKLTIPGETYVAGVFRQVDPTTGGAESAHVTAPPPITWSAQTVQIVGDRH